MAMSSLYELLKQSFRREERMTKIKKILLSLSKQMKNEK